MMSMTAKLARELKSNGVSVVSYTDPDSGCPFLVDSFIYLDEDSYVQVGDGYIYLIRRLGNGCLEYLSEITSFVGLNSVAQTIKESFLSSKNLQPELAF